MPHVEQDMLTLPEHLMSPLVFIGVHVVSRHCVFPYFPGFRLVKCFKILFNVLVHRSVYI